MRVIHSIDEIELNRNSIVTVGTFDGVHLGHQEILNEVTRRAKLSGGRSLCVTFDPHPKEIVGKQNQPVELLTTIEERIEHFEKLSVDVVFVIRFTYEFSRQTPREFYERYLVNGLGISEDIEGFDHMFGRDREGGIEELKMIGSEFGFTVTIIPPRKVDGEILSSTRIRQLLWAGDVRRAAKFLGREYSLDGAVVKGAGRGVALGYPTANIEPLSKRKLVPKDGIYFVLCAVKGHSYYGMMNIGTRPTFETDHRRTVEVNLFDFDQMIYGERIRVQFLDRLRDEVRFDSVEALVHQLELDREECLRRKEQFIHNVV
jgi:riboflavin kinase/FMN adenylyltransferase